MYEQIIQMQSGQTILYNKNHTFFRKKNNVTCGIQRAKLCFLDRRLGIPTSEEESTRLERFEKERRSLIIA